MRPVAQDPVPPTEAGNGGIFYVLVDQQENVEPRASYYHESRRITSENGVQNGAAISVSFDPSYQKLVFHFLRLIREGTIADRLDRSHIKLLQREREMESFLYDGSFTAHCQLEDVRVGDVIEYAYTVEGANPVLKGKYSALFSTEWTTPEHQAVVRIVYPERRTLHFLAKNRAIQPAISQRLGITEWQWEERKIAARQIDANTPADYHPFGKVQVSEFADWSKVVEWATPLYEVDPLLSADLKREIARLRALPNSEERILAALRFVQEEIRYLGIESGVGSHQPTAPGEVLRRRFGDCKDKTLLLATLLRNCDVKATPALVSSFNRRSVAECLPSPHVFDHVILQIETGKDTWWLDATRSCQRGPLSQISIGNFGYALVLRPGTRELSPFKPPTGALPKKKVIETYRIPRPDGMGHLEVISEYRGRAAESTRAYFQKNSRDEIEKTYLQYYARRFPRTQSARTLEYRELPNENGCEVKEHYLIPGLWQINDDQTQYLFTLHPSDIAEEMGTPGPALRADPLALNHPIDTTVEIRAEMFEDWKLEPTAQEIENAFFRYKHSSKGTGRNIQMTYSYQSLVDRVATGDLSIYDTALRKLKDALGYTFTYSTPDQLALRKKDSKLGAGQFNWPIALLMGFLVSATIPFPIRYYRSSKLPESLPPPLTPRSLEGIGGWLLLVAFGLLVRPITFLVANFQIYPSVFNLENWQGLTQIGQANYHPFWMAILLFELTYNTLAFIFCLLLLVLFFKKRAAWPRCFIAFFIFVVSGLLIDLLLAHQIPATAALAGESTKSLVHWLGAAAIWIPYSLKSKRVKATFRF